MLKILAVDQARNGAWAVFDYEKKTLEAYGTFSFSSSKYTYAKAILEIESLIDSIIRAYHIDAVFIEDIQLRVNVHSFKRLAQLQGVLVNLFEKNQYLYDFVAPAQWQNYCKARGRSVEELKKQLITLESKGKKSSKVFSIEKVRELFGIDTDNDNLADAILQGFYVVNNVSFTEDKTGEKSIQTKQNRRKAA